MAGEQRGVVRVGAGAVVDEVLAPAVEDVAVGVGEAVGDVALDLAGAGFEPPDAGVVVAMHAVVALDLRLVERALLEVERAVRGQDEAVGGVVRVGRVEPVQELLADVGLVVAVGVLEEQQVGGHGHEHAAVPELEAGRVVQVVGEDLRAVGLAVAVGVLQDQQLVVHRLLGLPVRIGRPGGDPQPALGVEGHLHRVDQLGELLLGGEQVDLHAVGDGHLLDGLFAAEEHVLAAGQGAGQVRLDRDERGRVAVVDLQILSLSRGPDPLVAVGRHDVEDLHLALHDDAVGDAVGVLQARAAADRR